MLSTQFIYDIVDYDYVNIMSTVLTNKRKTNKNVEFVAKISKFSGDRRVICIPNYMVEKLTNLEGKHIRVTLEDL